MDNKKQYILIAITVFMFLFTATIIYQQKKIIKLKNEINIKNEPKEKQAVSKKNGRNNPINSPFTVQAVQKNFQNRQPTFN